MTASETADLLDPSAWAFTQPLGNPGAVAGPVMHDLWGMRYPVDGLVRQAQGGLPLPELSESQAVHAGFGSLQWRHGVPVREMDHLGHGHVRPTSLSLLV